MLTLFATAKPFQGHSAVIQRNALRSWKLLHPDIEVILFGDDAGAAEVCRELSLHHEPRVGKNLLGTNRVDFLFLRAQEMGRHDLLCYSNCDIIFTSDFVAALSGAAEVHQQFLMVGRRWDTEITEPLDFSNPKWEESIIGKAKTRGFQRPHYNIDYFAFRRGLYREMPPLAVGRRWWDQWTVWSAGARGFPVIDASEVVCAVHQNHDYSTHPQGMKGTWFGEEAGENFKLAGGWSHLHTIEDARFRLTPQGIEPNRFYWLAPAKRRARRVNKAVRSFARTWMWHPLLDRTRRFRHALGLRQELFPTWLRRKSRRHWLDV